jgi:hypothetical protein
MMNHNTNNNKILYITIIVLVLILLGTFSYIGYQKYKESKVEKDNLLRGEGYQYAIAQMMTEAVKCTPVPLTFNNQTITMFALDCNNLAEVASAVLQQRAAAQQATPTNTTN